MSLSASFKSVSYIILTLQVAIGDGNVLQFWEYKKGEMIQAYKSPEPFANDVSRVVVSGLGDKASVFVAQGT